MIDRFLAVERVRFGPRLGVDISAGDAGTCLVPPLILQPLVENAVTHGIAHVLEGGLIRVFAGRAGSMLRIVAENPCDPDRPRTRGVGLGLEVLRQRLTTQFGLANAVHAAEGVGRYRVEVRLPVETTT